LLHENSILNFSAIFRFGLLIENKVVLIQLKPEEAPLYNQKFNKADIHQAILFGYGKMRFKH